MYHLEIIFTCGRDGIGGGFEGGGLRCDVLLLFNGHYYNPQFIELERLVNEVNASKGVCYLEDNMVVCKSLNNDVIIAAVKEMIAWKFYEKWLPVTSAVMDKYFYPDDDWEVVAI